MQDNDTATDATPETGLEPLFELGGPAYRLMQRIGIIKGAGPSIERRVVAFIAITWVPMLLFALLEGYAIGPTPRSSLLLDFTTYIRFFVGVPLLFAAEIVAGPRIRAAGLRFLEADIVNSADRPAFQAAADRAARRREAALPEILFMAAGLIGAWFLNIEQIGGVRAMTWHTISSGQAAQTMPAGLWYSFVAVPLVQFFLLRWLWRLTIWTLFLRDVSRLRLNLTATHSDMAGGLGFLGTAHVSLSIFPFAMGCVLAAEIAFRAQFEGMDLTALRSMIPLLIVYLILAELFTFGPLLVVAPTLARVRREGLRSYGILVQKHNKLFNDKWIETAGSDMATPLGSPDMSSLIDLGSSFETVRRMTIFPVARSQLVSVAIIVCLPILPVLLLIMPLSQVIGLLVNMVI